MSECRNCGEGTTYRQFCCKICEDTYNANKENDDK